MLQKLLSSNALAIILIALVMAIPILFYVVGGIFILWVLSEGTLDVNEFK